MAVWSTRWNTVVGVRVELVQSVWRGLTVAEEHGSEGKR